MKWYIIWWLIPDQANRNEIHRFNLSLQLSNRNSLGDSKIAYFTNVWAINSICMTLDRVWKNLLYTIFVASTLLLGAPFLCFALNSIRWQWRRKMNAPPLGCRLNGRSGNGRAIVVQNHFDAIWMEGRKSTHTSVIDIRRKFLDKMNENKIDWNEKRNHETKQNIRRNRTQKFVFYLNARFCEHKEEKKRMIKRNGRLA